MDNESSVRLPNELQKAIYSDAEIETIKGILSSKKTTRKTLTNLDNDKCNALQCSLGKVPQI